MSIQEVDDPGSINRSHAFLNHPGLRGLIEFIKGIDPTGIGGALDGYVVKRLEQIQRDRLETLLDELEKGKRYLTPEIIQQEDFLHNFVRVYNSAIKTQHHEKIKMFARLLTYGIQEKLLATDEMEEFITILEDLSMRGLNILLTLKHFQDQHPRQSSNANQNSEVENELQWISRFWDDFISTVQQRYNISQDDLRAFLTRLTRTGLYEAVAGTYIGYQGGKGSLTPLFEKFVQWITLNDETETAIEGDV